MPYHRRGTSTLVTGSPRLVRPHTAATPNSPRWTPTLRRARSELPPQLSKENSATSDTKHTLSEPHEEVGPSSPSMPSLPQSVQPFPAPYPSEPPGTAECRGNGAHRHSHSVDKGSNTSSGMLEPTSTAYEPWSSTDISASCPDVSNNSTASDPNYELSMKAIESMDAVRRSVLHIFDAAIGASHGEVSCSASSRSSLPSFDPDSSHTSLHSTSRTSLHSTSHGKYIHKTPPPQSGDLGCNQNTSVHGRHFPAHRNSLPWPSSEHKSATLPRTYSTPTRSSTEPELSHHQSQNFHTMNPGNMSGEKEFHQATNASQLKPKISGPTQKPEEHSHEHTELPKGLPTELPRVPPAETSTPGGKILQVYKRGKQTIGINIAFQIFPSAYINCGSHIHCQDTFLHACR